MNVALDKNNQDTAFYDLCRRSRSRQCICLCQSMFITFLGQQNPPRRGWLTGIHYPQFETNPLLSPFTPVHGGIQSQTGSRQCAISTEWRENDGITSTRSMSAPINGSTDLMVNYSPYQTR